MDFNQLWADLVAWSVTDEVQRCGAVGLATAILYGSIWIAIAQNMWLKNLNAEFFETSIPGRKPIYEDSIQRQIDRLEAFKVNQTATSSVRTALLIASGFIIPSLVVGLITYYFPWLFGAHALVHNDESEILDPTFFEVTWSVLSQLALGAIGDQIALFPGTTIATPNVAFATANPIVLVGVIGFRYLVSIFVVGLTNFLRVLVRVTIKTDPKLKELRTDLEAVRAQNATDSTRKAANDSAVQMAA